VVALLAVTVPIKVALDLFTFDAALVVAVGAAVVPEEVMVNVPFTNWKP
jgi:hypothetical protein